MSLYDMFFELELNICDRFPNLSPFDVRKQRVREVFLLVRRLNNFNSKKTKEIKRQTRRPAGDNWF